eukprot:gene14728-biopygen644
MGPGADGGGPWAHSASAISAPLPHGQCGGSLLPPPLRGGRAPLSEGRGAPGTAGQAARGRGPRGDAPRLALPLPGVHVWRARGSISRWHPPPPRGAKAAPKRGGPARASRGGPEQLVPRTLSVRLANRLRSSFGIEEKNTTDDGNTTDGPLPCCAALCRAVLRGAQLCSAGLRCPGLRCAALWHVLPHCALRRSAMPRYATLIHATLRPGVPG